MAASTGPEAVPREPEPETTPTTVVGQVAVAGPVAVAAPEAGPEETTELEAEPETATIPEGDDDLVSCSQRPVDGNGSATTGGCSQDLGVHPEDSARPGGHY